MIEQILHILPIRYFPFWDGNLLNMLLFICCALVFSWAMSKINLKITLSLYILSLLIVLLYSKTGEELYGLYFLLTFLIIIISILNILKERKKYIIKKEKENSKKLTLIISLLFIYSILILIFYFSPSIVNKEAYIYGADVWYHLSINNQINNGLEYGKASIFESGHNQYGPLFYYSNEIISIITDLKLEATFIFLYGIFFIFLSLTFFILVRRFLDTNTAFISTLFAELFFITWAYAPNLYGKIFLFILIFTILIRINLTSKIFLSFILILSTYKSHYQYFLFIIIILFFYLIISKTDKKFDWINRLYSKFHKTKSAHTEKYATLFILFILLFIAIIYKLSNFQINPLYWEFINYVSEIPIYPMIPLAIVSWISFLPGLLCVYAKVPRFKFYIILSILGLLMNSFFYFIKQFQFHQIYFGEFSFLIVILPVGVYFLKGFWTQYNHSGKMITLALVIFLIFSIIASLGITLERNYSYTSNSMNFEKNTMLGLEELDNLKNQTVIVSPPCNYVNRFLILNQFIRIYSVDFGLSMQCKSPIITNINEKVETYGFAPNLKEKNNLSYAFYENPNKENYANLNQYKLDFILIPRSEYNIKNESYKILINQTELKIFFENEKYVLLKKS